MIDTDILFAVILTGCFLWTTFYLLFAGHYFIATIVDSAAGVREVSFPADNIIDRIWRPGLCLWILFFWGIMGSILLGPLLAAFPRVYAGVMPVLLWILFPISLLSILYTQNWLFMIHPKLMLKKMQHIGAFAYVHAITLVFAAIAAGLIALVTLHSFYWAMPAAFILPTLILLYARHWGRFAWLALYGERRRERKQAKAPMDDETLKTLLKPDAVPEVEVEEFNPEVEGIRGGLPAAYPGVMHLPASPDAAAVPAATAVLGLEEEEDEFSQNKQPYVMIEPPSPGMEENLSVSVADSKPMPLSQFYDEQHRQEKEKKRKEAANNRFLPPQTGDPPDFKKALLYGVWEFLFYPTTLHAWAILIALTIVELFFIAMVVRNWPDNNGG